MLKGIGEEATYFYHPDHLGSVSVVSNHQGEPYERVEYLPFGEVWIEDVDAATRYIPFRFTSKELDRETGLYYYGARYYEPKVSRWMSADPAGFALINPNQGGYSVIEASNWYSYVSNNPVKYVDPTGEEEVVGIDTTGNFLFARNYKLKTANITVTRQDDGFGNKHDSVATLESVTMENGQSLRIGKSTMVGANAKSESFAATHKGMTLPDAEYYLTGETSLLHENSEGGYDSTSYHNVKQIQTNDKNIPEKTRDAINNGAYLLHATEYKEGVVKNGIHEWDNPSSAGCIITQGDQPGHDKVMEQIPSAPNIVVKIQSLSNIRYHHGNKYHE